MARDGSGVYSLPANTLAVSGDPISSTKFNTLVQDIESDLNVDRPVAAGGTGASTAAGARTNLGLGTAAVKDTGTSGDTVPLLNTACTFSAAPGTEADPALTVTRTFSGTAASRIATMTLRNTGDAAGGSDYQNEVHLRLWAGTTTTHRRYIDFMKFNGAPDYVMGSNAGGTFILFDEDANVHRLWIENGSTLSGDTMINAAGASGKVRIGYHAADTCPPTAFNLYVGGAPASNYLAFSFDAANGVFRKYLHTDGTTQQFIIDADGDVGVGVSNPSHKVDISTTGGAPLRFVWNNGSFAQAAHSATWTTTGTNASNMLTLTDGDNSDTRAVLRLLGNAGAVEVMFASSSGKVGIGTATPGQALDVTGTVRASTSFLVGANTVWHAGNDGAGSGLDADTVDGIQASSFATIAGSETLTNKTLTSPTINGGTIQSRVQASSETSGTLTSASANKTIQATGDITINNSVFSAGDLVLYYAGASARTITAGTITTMRLAATATTGTRSVAARGVAMLFFVSATEVVVGGPGVT